MLSLNLILVALGITHAPERNDLSHNNAAMSQPSQTWYHPPDHPVHALFGRAPNDSPQNYAPVGSPEWSAGFPIPSALSSDSIKMPDAWVNALNSAMAAGKIRNISVSTSVNESTPVYPNGADPTSPDICSGSYQCAIPGDIWNGPDGIFASSFDDGPTTHTSTLVNFLQSKNLTTTHFMIGGNILQNPDQFLSALHAGDDITVHTYTHPYMTTLSNDEVLRELGWTMLLIINSTEGRIPKYWRPPFGDVDVRVSDIAREVFHLETVVWNQDTRDWSQNSTDPINDFLKKVLSGPKSPGLIILEHELSEITVSAFMEAFALIAQNGWKFVSLVQALGKMASDSNPQNPPSRQHVTPGNTAGPVSSTSSLPSTGNNTGTLTAGANPTQC